MYNVNVMRWAYRRYDPIDDPDNLKHAIRDIATRNRLRYDVKIDVERAFAACWKRQPVDYGVLYDVLMSQLWLVGTKTHWIEKNQLLWREIPEFLRLMPNGRVVMVIRDPRSVLASFKRFTFAPEPAYLGAIFNSFDALRMACRYMDTLDRERFTVVRYEDAAREPVNEATRVFRFIGVDPDDAQSEKDQWRSAYGHKWITDSVFAMDGEAFNVDAAIERWRNNLDQDEVALTEFVCGDLMSAFGYEPSGVTLDWPKALERFIGDCTLSDWFSRYLLKGEGVQSFPLDPIEPANWSEAHPGYAPKELDADEVGTELRSRLANDD